MRKEEGSAAIEFSSIVLVLVILWSIGVYAFNAFAMPYIEVVQAEAEGAAARIEGDSIMSFFTQLNNSINSDTVKGDLESLADGHVYHVASMNPGTGKYGDYFCFTISERPGYHFFSKTAITRKFEQIWNAGKVDELASVGCTFIKSHADMYDRDYIDVIFRD